MSFKKRQLIGLISNILFLIFFIFVVVFLVNTMRSAMLEIAEDRYVKVSNVTEIRQEFYELDRQLLNLIRNEAGMSAEARLSRMEESNNTIHLMMSKLSGTLNTDQGKQLFIQLDESYRSYWQMEQQMVALMNTGNTSEMQEIYDQGRDNRNQLLTILADFKQFQEEMLNRSLEDAKSTYETVLTFIIAASVVVILLITAVTMWVIRSTTKSINAITDGIKTIDYNDLSSLPRLEVKTADEIGDIAKAFNSMAASLEDYQVKEKRYTAEITEQNWVQSKSADIISTYSQFVTVAGLAEQVIQELTPMAGADLGVFYVKNEQAEDVFYQKIASFADNDKQAGRDSFSPGEGIVGQAVLDKKLIQINDIPDDYKVISTGLGSYSPRSILIAPILMNEDVVGVIELAGLQPFTTPQLKLVKEALETLGIAMTNISGRMEIVRLLQESQAQTEELQTQSEELQSQSEELQAQSEEMQTQAEELRIINEQLEERTRDAELKSEELQAAKEELEEKAKELMLSSKYKSEFLANMSHELRTPLNSILLLSEMLEEDPDKVLTEEQREFSRVIHSSGQDLLSLINDILDLSKVEVGKMDIKFEEVYIQEFAERIKMSFSQMAKHKELEFILDVDDNLPPIFYSDEKRLQQIVKNLLSNAFKFTEKGSVSISFEKAKPADYEKLSLFSESIDWLKVSVEDTGIGIPKDKQRMIFEAFQQADGATMRKYGGTGLGLSISKEFAALLGGICKVERSVEDKGSCFSLIIPSLPEGIPALDEEKKAMTEAASTAEIFPLVAEQHSIAELEEEQGAEVEYQGKVELAGKTVLVVDDDNRNIYALQNALKKEGMHVIAAENGMQCIDTLLSMDVVDIVLMDIMMPVMDGYETMKKVRGLEKHKDVPIIALTAKAMKGDREKCLEAGASDYISKPLKLDQLFSAMRVWLTK